MSTAVPLDRSGASNFSIPDIVRLAAEGSIRVPTFQRDFAWRAEDIRRLFDSIYRGFPVGTLLLWGKEAPAATVTLGPISINVPEKSSAYWVVDGQQRITSLFAALSPLHARVDDRFEVYFDLENESFNNARHGKIPARAIPVREALETRSLLQWLRTHADELEERDFDVADRLGGALRDYQIPAYVVAGDNQELLREVFDRVNSAGKPISRAQAFHALFAGGDEPASPSSVVDNLQQLGFGKIDEGRVVQSLLALRGGDVQRDIRNEFEPTQNASEWFDRTESALAAAIKFLRGQGVPHLLLMPNTLPLPVLAAFFYLHPQPDSWTKQLLARWLWRGWVHDFGREGGQTPVLRRAIRAINPDFSDPENAPTEFDAVRSLLEYTPDRPVPELSLENFNTKNANSRLILLASASRHPMNYDGTMIDLSKQFELYGSNAVTTFVPRARTIASARGFWPVDSESVTKVEDPDVLASHLIDKVAIERLRKADTDAFLTIRAAAINSLVRDFLDSRVEPGKQIRPPLRQLAIEDAVDL